MIKEFTSFLIEAIQKNGARSVFWAGLIEQVISPIPSVLIPMSGGVLLIPQKIDFFQAIIKISLLVSFPYVLGAVIGSSVLYFGSFYGGRALIKKFGNFFGISLKNVDRFRKKFTRGFKDELIIFFWVILPVTPISLVAVSCGIIGISAFEFYPLLLIGMFFRSLFLGWLGWQVGKAYQLIGTGLGKIENLLSITGLATILIILAFLYYRRQKMLAD